MHTVELLLEDRLEVGVRELWNVLLNAGLPSLAAHPHPTNRPHLTVLTAPALAGLPRLGLPIAAGLGPVRMLGRALVREVTPTDELRALNASAPPGAWPPPDEFVPHVSLALKVPPDRQAEALALLADVPPVSGHFVAARSYDTASRTVIGLE